MTLTEVMVSTAVWMLTAVGVLQIWVAGGSALSGAQDRQQALEAIDADLLRARARVQSLRLQPSGLSAECSAVAPALLQVLQVQPLRSLPGLTRQLRREGNDLWLSYTYARGDRRDVRQRLLSPEAFGLCASPSPPAATPPSPQLSSALGVPAPVSVLSA